jgi:hypothetical protein
LLHRRGRLSPFKDLASSPDNVHPLSASRTSASKPSCTPSSSSAYYPTTSPTAISENHWYRCEDVLLRLAPSPTT